MAVYKAPDDPQKNKTKEKRKKQTASQNTNVYRPSGRHTKTEREEYYRQKELAHKKRRNRALGVIVALLLIVAVVFAIVLIGRGMNAEEDKRNQRAGFLILHAGKGRSSGAFGRWLGRRDGRQHLCMEQAGLRYF